MKPGGISSGRPSLDLATDGRTDKPELGQRPQPPRWDDHSVRPAATHTRQRNNPFATQTLPLLTVTELDVVNLNPIGILPISPDQGIVRHQSYPLDSHKTLARKNRNPSNFQRKLNESSTITLVTILSMLCDSKCQGNKDHGRKLFDYMCNKLSGLGVSHLNKAFKHETLASMCSTYYNGFDSLITNYVQTTFGSHTSSDSNVVIQSLGPRYLLSNNLLPLDLPITYYLTTQRYATEFEEISLLGKGAFGQVFKVRNKFDTMPYAVKKILISFQNNEDLKAVQREVQLFASLHHVNIVGYYNAWYETYDRSAFSGSTSPTSGLSETGNNNDNEESSETSNDVRFESSGSEQTAFVCRSTCSYRVGKVVKEETGAGMEEEGAAMFETFSEEFSSRLSLAQSSAAWRRRAVDSTQGNSMTSLVGNNRFANSSTVKGFPLILYIQMELCKETLEQFLDRRNSDFAKRDVHIDAVDGAMCENIFYQILAGVEYIHSKGVMHRDLKPSNIFVNDVDELTVKIGDFGLARPDWSCTIDELREFVGPLTPTASKHAALMTADVGTRTYAAPEQLDGSQYDQKADMYSLGIINFELFYPMRTVMERARTIARLKESREPIEEMNVLRERWPFQAKVIERLLSKDPRDRPTAKEILTSRPVKSDKDLIWELQQRLKEKDETIARQVKVIAKSKRKVAGLRSVLARTQSQLKDAKERELRWPDQFHRM